MSHEVDGNEYFLNRYLDEQDKTEISDEVSDKEEFTGEEMYNLLGDEGFEGSMESLHEATEKYPDGGFDGAIKTANDYLNQQEVLSDAQYLKVLVKDFYKRTQYWFDTKWLALEGSEGNILEKVVEFVGDIIYDSATVGAEDYVEIYMVGNELLDRYHRLDQKVKSHAQSMLHMCRKEVALEGLKASGLTEQLLLTSTPEEISNRLVANTKEVGRNRKRLQVSKEVYDEGMSTLGLAEENSPIEKVYGRHYANVYKLYKRPTKSRDFPKVVTKINQLLALRHSKDSKFPLMGKEAKDAGLVMYKAGSSWVVIGSRLTVFYPSKDGSKIVYNKPLSEVRVKDMEQIAKTVR